MKYPSILFILILLVASCEKKLDFPNKSLENIVGEWRWEESRGGPGSQIFSPDTEGYVESLLFRRNGEFISYRDSIERLRYFYWVEEPQAGQYVLSIGSRDRVEVKYSYYLQLGGKDSLFLEETCLNCFRYSYLRLD